MPDNTANPGSPELGDWVPDACSLPTAEQPLRVAEFDDLFATALRRVERISPVRLTLHLDSAAERAARELTARETACCSFFAFDFAASGDDLALGIEVPAERADALVALGVRAEAALGVRAEAAVRNRPAAG